MTVVTVLSDKDTSIDQYWNTGNGSHPGMSVASWRVLGWGATVHPRNWRVLVGFNLATIPEGVTIQSAVLKLFVMPTQQIAPGRTYQIHRITGSWSEAVTKWSNQPAVDPTPVEADSPSIRGAFYDVDVTDIFLMGPRIGFRVKDKVETEISVHETDFYARERAGTGQDPRLVIEYYEYPPEEPPEIPPEFPPVPPEIPPVVPPEIPPVVPPEIPPVMPPAFPPAPPAVPPGIKYIIDRLKLMFWILSDIKEEIRPIAIKANTYTILTLDLSTAHLTFQTHYLSGFAITILTCTGTLDLRIGDLATDSITIAPLIYPQTIVIDMMDFAKLYSQNAAQPGREAILIIWRRE